MSSLTHARTHVALCVYFRCIALMFVMTFSSARQTDCRWVAARQSLCCTVRGRGVHVIWFPGRSLVVTMTPHGGLEHQSTVYNEHRSPTERLILWRKQLQQINEVIYIFIYTFVELRTVTLSTIWHGFTGELKKKGKYLLCSPVVGVISDYMLACSTYCIPTRLAYFRWIRGQPSVSNELK